MYKAIYLGFLVISAYSSLPCMELPKKATPVITLADIALKAADTCYFDSDKQDYVRAAELYKKATSGEEKYVIISGLAFASHMLTIMAFAQQGGLSFDEWKTYATQTHKLLDGIHSNLDLKNGFFRAGVSRFERILKATPAIKHTIINKVLPAIIQDSLQKSKVFLSFLNNTHLEVINQLSMIHTVNTSLKKSSDNKKFINFEDKSTLLTITEWISNLTQYFQWHLQFQKETTNKAFPPYQKLQSELTQQEYTSIQKSLEGQINLQQVIKIESDILNEMSIELITNLTSLFLIKKIKLEDVSNVLKCLQETAQIIRNDNHITSISNNILHNPDTALKVLGSFYRKKKWLNLERAQKYLNFAISKSKNYDKFIPNGLIAMAEAYFHGLGTPPNYNRAVDYFKMANQQGTNVKAQVRAALALGHMYFYGDTKNSNADALQPDYTLAETYLSSAVYQHYVPKLSPVAAILLGHMYHYGYGGTCDENLALKYYQIATSQNYDLPLQNRAQKEINEIQNKQNSQF